MRLILEVIIVASTLLIEGVRSFGGVSLLSPYSSSSHSSNKIHPMSKRWVRPSAALREFHSSAVLSSMDDNNDNNNYNNNKEEAAHYAEMIEEPSSSTTGASSAPSPTEKKSVFQKVDDYCVTLKPRAVTAHAQARSMAQSSQKKNTIQQLGYTVKSCSLFGAFMAWRAYRGFFVILPAVWHQVYLKMEAAVVRNDPFLDDDDDTRTTPNNNTGGRVRVRTTVVVSVLSFLVTLSYVLTGATRVLVMFVRTATRTSSLEPAFEAAADELVSNEGKILTMTTTHEQQRPSTTTTNREDSVSP